jgi:hypothetical protein
MSLNNKQVIINQIISMGIFFVISIAILLLLPFPISLVTIIGVFILLNFYMRNRMMRKMGIRMRGGGEMSGSTSSSSSSMFGDNSLKYYCMSCGTQHKQAACPRCGSKMKRVGS